MNVLPILYHLRGALLNNRRTGATTFIRTIGNIGGVVICATEQHAKEVAKPRLGDFELQTVSMQDTSGLSRLEGRDVALVLDNHAVTQLCTFAIDHIQKQHEDYQILTNHHEESKRLWAQEMQGQKKHYEERIQGLEGQLSGWKRIARTFRFSNPAWLDKHLETKRRR